MANIAGVIFKGQIGSAHRELGSNALILEVLERISASNEILIYGSENSNAGVDDLQMIGHIVSYVIQEHAAAGGANRYGTLSNSETTNDLLTIASSNDVIYQIWVVGYPGKA